MLVDSIFEEFAIRPSKFSAELGQTGNAIMNVTLNCGTNQFHGSAYEYFVNEFMNAGQPFTNNGNGNLIRPGQRRNDYGFTLGRAGVNLPKLYNSSNKTFFFGIGSNSGIGQNVCPTPLSGSHRGFWPRRFKLDLVEESNRHGSAGPSQFPNQIYDPATPAHREWPDCRKSSRTTSYATKRSIPSRERFRR